MGVRRTVDNAPDKNSATTNFVYVAPNDELVILKFIEVTDYVFNIAAHPDVPSGSIALNSIHRKLLRVSAGDEMTLAPYSPPTNLSGANLVYGQIDYVVDKVRPCELNANDIVERLLKCFAHQILSTSQQIVFELQGSNYKMSISSLLIDNAEVQRAWLRDTTAFIFLNTGQHPIKIIGQKGYASHQLFKSKVLNFESLGIGGLDTQFEHIFRRAFASRVFPPTIVERMGIHHVKGMLLFGPPGTGKTLIARQIGKMLNGKEPKIVNGPEILSKFVGQAEENIRNLFAEAEVEYKAKGDQSDLHIIIFDEIDAICKQRGSSRDGTGVHDTIVNQLLTKIDGVDALNNILLIGMTNRKDMLDEAMLRPGRLEVQIEIGLPDEKGRLQILKIHTSKMSANSFLARDVDLFRLAEATKNFSGAEIEGLVKDAAAYALNRNIDLNNLNKPLDEDTIKVTMDDFEHALTEVVPAFGAATEALAGYCTYGIIHYGAAFDHLRNTLRALVAQVRNSDKTPVLSCLLEGLAGAGKSALAAHTAIESEFPFVKVISPESLVGYSEALKASAIARIFEDAYKSPLSIIILDDIERLLEYVKIGPRFSNIILQTLLVLVKRNPPADKKLLILGTTSAGDVLESMELTQVFNVTLHVPSLRTDEIIRVLRETAAFEVRDLPVAVERLTSICGQEVPLKKLLLWLEMARQEVAPGQRICLERWEQTLEHLSS